MTSPSTPSEYHIIRLTGSRGRGPPGGRWRAMPSVVSFVVLPERSVSCPSPLLRLVQELAARSPAMPVQSSGGSSVRPSASTRPSGWNSDLTVIGIVNDDACRRRLAGASAANAGRKAARSPCAARSPSRGQPAAARPARRQLEPAVGPVVTASSGPSAQEGGEAVAGAGEGGGAGDRGSRRRRRAGTRRG